MGGILVFAESDGAALRPELWELVTVARELAGSVGGGVRLALAGAPDGAVVAEASRSGADELHVLEDERLGEPWPELQLEALAALCAELEPQLVLLPRTVLGTELAGRLAARTGWALVTDATRAAVGAAGLEATRPVFGGAVVATVRAPDGPWIVVPRPRAFAAAAPGQVTSLEPVRHCFALPEPRSRAGARTRVEAAGPDLERATVVVAGGAGLGGPEPFTGVLREIADLLGGTVGASRPACDAGWVEPALQVGLTGKTVAPRLYLAVAISGATQHLMGCSSSETIVAVNSDAAAPIFRVANYGVVGDWQEVLPAFRDALRAKLVTGGA